ncbi:hypothetical protein DXN05_01550 [Deminuibacter soli]|uniref:Glycoside hydrolase 123-like N-terminal domain-containing protein n=2 Tax=Deminuibacter soli TaxID=2291815 RepID=A0A3E1NS61_9BACT|nr:hypothetical protein DXN05_01550 [Deminuibacter soli]
MAQELHYTNGNNAWNPDSLGNHRIVLQVAAPGNAVHAHIAWRRNDNDPQLKRIIVTDAQNHRIDNVFTENITREAGDIYFQPVQGKGTYYVYYLPYKNEGRSNYPRGVYVKADTTASATWLNQLHKNTAAAATVKELQAINAFNSFYPMEVIATAAETQQLLAKYPGKAYLVFPEDRLHAIKMKTDLPYRWIKSGVQQQLSGTSDKGAYYAFQLGVYALQQLQNVHVQFSDLKTAGGAVISSDKIDCINTTGLQYDGKPFKQTVQVAAHDIQPLWCGVDVPAAATPGVYKGTATVQCDGMPATTIQLQLTVSNTTAVNGGVNTPENMTRVKWLNSAMAQENTVIAPYTPLAIQDSTINLLGRNLKIGKDGLPAQIQTFFTPEMTSVSSTPNNLFTEPVHFHFTDAANKNFLHWKTNGFTFTRREPGTVAWEATSTSEALEMQVSATMEFDGFVAYSVKFTALNDVQLNDINLHLPMQPDASKYLMGLGLKGGNRPDTVQWKWDVAHKNQDGAWIGSVNAGLQFSLRDEHYVRPLNTNFYLQKPLLLPTSWGNSNKGGIDVFQKGKAILVNAYSGARNMKKGEVLYYNFNLLITPFHAINTDFQWSTRFYHKYDNLDTIKATGATVVNIHHGTPINPWINYPFIEWKQMKSYIDEAHSKGLKVKIYNTIRELSNHTYELPVLRSLGHEVYSPGKGGGFTWLQEHVGSDYIAAWFVPEVKDAAIINSGMNRWHNYYVEGMNWLVQNVGIDGIYLDDVAFDRVTMKRIKRVLTNNGHPGIIDLHSANQYNPSDGFNNSANLYMEHFPYLNRLWYGEYFDYNKNNPDFFLTEVSGIPFGLMGEMLQDGGNPWRGMIYGMTNRLGWTNVNDPRPLWKLWQSFGLEKSAMIGYWSGNCPVTTSNGKVLATVYKKDGKAMVAIASWADADTEVQLNIDWKALGIDAAKARITAPAIEGFQQAGDFTKNALPVAKGKGWLLVIE